MLANGRYLQKSTFSFPKILKTSVRIYSDVGKTKDKIPHNERVVIHPRIERKPTDILKALASTVGTDFTAHPIGNLDDPVFYPHSDIDRKLISLAKESGKKSARWFFDKYPEFFKQELSEPPIKAFTAASPVDESETTEETLIDAISERNVSLAIQAYKSLQNKNMAVSDETRQCLLELVCFYNSKDPLSDYPEEKWFLTRNPDSGFVSSWENESFAEELYLKMNSDCPYALSTIILAYFRHRNLRSGYVLYENALVKNIPLPVSVFNFVLQYGPLLTDKTDKKSILLGTLKTMASRNVKPNLGTLNSFLLALDKSNFLREKTELALGVFETFTTKLNIQPSLGSYVMLFSILKHYRGKKYNGREMISNMMKEIEGREHEILHPLDFNFFWISFKVFSEHLKDVDLTLRLNDMLWNHNNIKFIIANVTLNDCLHSLFRALCQEKHTEFVWDFYRKYKFKFFVPRATLLKMLIRKIEESPEHKYLSETWEDLRKIRKSDFRPVLREVLTLAKVFEDEPSLKILHKAALSYLKKTEIQNLLGEDSEAFSACLEILVKNDDAAVLSHTLELIAQKPTDIRVKDESVSAAFDYAMAKNMSEVLVLCLRIAAAENHEETHEMAKKALPFLSGENEAFAKSLMKPEKKKRETPPSTP